jgi:GNAT superfamily N-acetyltransferase
LIVFRPFRNIDPPAIVEIWNAQPSFRGLAAPMSIDLFERTVLSKPYFDRHGLIVAVERAEETGSEERPIAFAHAGFGFGDVGQNISRDSGAIYLVQSLAHPEAGAVRRALLAECESYLRVRGAKILFGGPTGACDAFYLGLCQGARASGVLASDAAALSLFRDAGYREEVRYSVLQRRLAGFRPLIDRQQMQIRRGHAIEATLDPPLENWRQACTIGAWDRTTFSLLERGAARPIGQAQFWDLGPLGASWGVSATGLSHIEIAAEKRRKGLGLFLLGEAMRHLQTHGAALIEGHVALDNTLVLAWLKKLGFEEIDRAVEFTKIA